MDIQYYQPKSAILSKYIDSYYFIVKGSSRAAVRYLTFPNNFCILSSLLDSQVNTIGEKVVIKPSSDKNILSDLVVRYTKPIQVIYENPVNEITVKFKPLGLNHFVDNAAVYFNEGLNRDINSFTGLNEEMNKIFDLTDRKQQVERLESYWLSKLKSLKLGKIKSIVKDVESSLSIGEIAQKHDISKQYLNRLFLKNLGKTPSEYRKVYKFRKALKNFKSANDLTELSYNCLFYDQSHFIKEFKSLTNLKPSLFFKRIDTSKEGIWLYF